MTSGGSLEVGVDEDDGIAGRAFHAGGHGDLMAEIAGEHEDPHARIGVLEFPQEVQRGVAAAVVDIDELEVEIGDGFQCGDEAAMGLADDRFLVEAGDDDGQERPGATSVGGEVIQNQYRNEPERRRFSMPGAESGYG